MRINSYPASGELFLLILPNPEVRVSFQMFHTVIPFPRSSNPDGWKQQIALFFRSLNCARVRLM